MNFRKIGYVSLVCFIAVILNACGAKDEKPGAMVEEKTVVKANATVAEYEKNQLVNDADTVIEGEVISKEVQEDFEKYPVTDYRIAVKKVYKGTPVKEIVEVRTEGGETDKMIYIPDEDLVTFQLGEKVVLFLTDDKGQRPDRNDFDYFVVGQYQGKFKEESGKLKNGKFEFSQDGFKEELDKIMAENEAKNLKKLHKEDSDRNDNI